MSLDGSQKYKAIKIEVPPQKKDELTIALEAMYKNRQIGPELSAEAEAMLANIRNVLLANNVIIENEGYMPIDMWEEVKHSKLSSDIKCHIENYLEPDEAYDLKRLIFISIRARLGRK